MLCTHTGLRSGQLAWPRLTPKQAVTLGSVCGAGCGPTARRGWPGSRRCRRRPCWLRSPGHCFGVSPPTRPGLAEAGSSPRTQRAHVCKYSLKWKPRDGSWTFFPDCDVSLGQESWQSGEKRAFHVWREPSCRASADCGRGLGGGRRGQGGLSGGRTSSVLPSAPALCARVTSDSSCGPCCLYPDHRTRWLVAPSQQEPPLLGQSLDPSPTLLVRIQAVCDYTPSARMSNEPLSPTTRL